MKKKKLVHVGTFGSPQGLKGDIKINIFTSSPESFKLLKNYFNEDGSSVLIFSSIRKIGKRYVVSLDGCNDRDTALNFKGKKIFSFRENFEKANDDEYYVIDLINCEVFDMKKKYLGNVIDIKNFGAGDLIEILDNNKLKFYIPMNSDNLVNIDINKKKIFVNPLKGLLDKC